MNCVKRGELMDDVIRAVCRAFGRQNVENIRDMAVKKSLADLEAGQKYVKQLVEDRQHGRGTPGVPVAEEGREVVSD